MPHWTEGPPDLTEGMATRIVRTPPSGSLTAIVTSDKIRGCSTHFAHNRTVPCEKPEPCPWCQDGHSWRWHAYLSAVLCGSYEHVIFETTATASDTFKVYYAQHQTMRGCKFHAHRPSGRPNGRIVIACRRLDETRFRLPQELEIARILCHIWNVKYDADAFMGRVRRLADNIGTTQTPGDGRYKPDGNGQD